MHFDEGESDAVQRRHYRKEAFRAGLCHACREAKLHFREIVDF